jgi:hypothetical protein
VAALARTALVRLELAEQPVEVLLGGGLLQGSDSPVVEKIRSGLAELGSAISVRVTGWPPVVGAALLGLDEIGAAPEAYARVRAEVTAAADGAESKLEPAATGASDG